MVTKKKALGKNSEAEELKKEDVENEEGKDETNTEEEIKDEAKDEAPKKSPGRPKGKKFDRNVKHNGVTYAKGSPLSEKHEHFADLNKFLV